MRSLLIALLAFVAGVWLTTWWQPAAPAAAAAHPASAASVAAAPMAMDAVADDRWPAGGPSPEQVIHAQPRLVRNALAQLTPRINGKPNLYLVAFAGDASEDVFRNEVEYAATLFPARFGAATHTLVLENNPASLSTRPLASWSNLEAVLDGLARVMHPEDILMLYVTSHGSEDHYLLVDMDPVPLDQIGADDLAGILREHPFRWKVVVVNACYSGGFVPPLRGDGTLVITAARSDRSSFGCGSDSDITYFGKAWLVDALNRTSTFTDAFQRASKTIAGWESRDKLTPSEPQIDVGKGITAQLDLWRKGVEPGAEVPFAPATGATDSANIAH
ncbi:MAG TPA: C13 family peptidase [Rhodanobacter sp.]|nr:C13 family peptidase [Rhodanobacter sp.]